MTMRKSPGKKTQGFPRRNARCGRASRARSHRCEKLVAPVEPELDEAPERRGHGKPQALPGAGAHEAKGAAAARAARPPPSTEARAGHEKIACGSICMATLIAGARRAQAFPARGAGQWRQFRTHHHRQGKETFGVGGDPRRRRAKRAVPLWLTLQEFSGYVVGYETAAIGHGGEGALYVRPRLRERTTETPQADKAWSVAEGPESLSLPTRGLARTTACLAAPRRRLLFLPRI